MVVESNENNVSCVTDRKRARSSLKRSSKRAAGRCSLMKPLSDRPDSQGNVRRSPAYCIGQGAPLRRRLDSQVDEFPVAAGQAVDDLPERVRSRKVTEEHRYELGPGSEALGAVLRSVIGDKFFKVHGGKDLRKDLTEETRYLYHHDASVFRDVVALADMMIS